MSDKNRNVWTRTWNWVTVRDVYSELSRPEVSGHSSQLEWRMALFRYIYHRFIEIPTIPFCYLNIAHTFCQWKSRSYAESFAWRQRHILIDFHINIINLTLVPGMFLPRCPSNHIDWLICWRLLRSKKTFSEGRSFLKSCDIKVCVKRSNSGNITM